MINDYLMVLIKTAHWVRQPHSSCLHKNEIWSYGWRSTVDPSTYTYRRIFSLLCFGLLWNFVRLLFVFWRILRFFLLRLILRPDLFSFLRFFWSTCDDDKLHSIAAKLLIIQFLENVTSRMSFDNIVRLLFFGVDLVSNSRIRKCLGSSTTISVFGHLTRRSYACGRKLHPYTPSLSRTFFSSMSAGRRLARTCGTVVLSFRLISNSAGLSILKRGTSVRE